MGRGSPLGIVADMGRAALGDKKAGKRWQEDLYGKAPDLPEMPDPSEFEVKQTGTGVGTGSEMAGGQFELKEDEDELAMRKRGKKRKGRVELMQAPEAGVSRSFSDVGVKI